MKLNNLTASSFADEINVQRSSISHLLSGRNKPSLEFIQKVLMRFPKVDASWLVNGNTSVRDKSQMIIADSELEPQVQSIKKQEILSQASKVKQIAKVMIFYTDNSFQEIL